MTEISKDFKPSLTQPNYLIRTRLLQSIQYYAPRLKGNMMDFGCGQKPYKSLFTVEKYIGVDYENPGHSHKDEAIDVFYDGKHLPFDDNHFDSVFCSEVFEHIFNLDEILNEIHRVMKPGGNILITCPFAFCEHETPSDFARYTSFAIRHLMENAGFEIIEQQKTGNSIEAITQLQLMYMHQHIYPKLKSLPVIRSAFKIITYSISNMAGLALGKIMPAGKDLYMSNVLLCRKKPLAS
jgi:SAM-dependent methyltransferase